MTRSRHRLVLSSLSVAVLAVSWGCKKEPLAVALPTSRPTTQMATTAPTTKPVVLAPYLAFAKSIDPRIATTQPLAMPIGLDEGINLVTDDPVYVDPVGHLWITREGAAPAEEILAQKELSADLPHMVRDRVLFAHWTPDDEGVFHPTLIARGTDGSLVAITAKSRTVLATKRAYRWERATSWDARIIVPTDSGVGVLTVGPAFSEQYMELTAAPASSQPVIAKAMAPRPEWVFDAKGILAFVPWQNGEVGGNGAYRFVDGQWAHLDSWPAKIFHLVPLLDGSVLQLVTQDNGDVSLSTAALDTGPVDDKRIEQLVDQLSDLESQKRTDAFNELARFGPASWPVLERLKENQPPETQTYLAQLLENREQPTLGGFKLLGPKLQVVSRLAESGVVLFSRAGVETHEGFRASPTPITPAWLSIRPGRNVEILSTQMVGDLDPNLARIIVHGDEWVVITPTQGARRFLANHYETLLPKSKATFTEWQGTDRRGRWVFEKAVAPAASATTAPTSAALASSTLIIDPTVPDPAPRLPCWPIEVKGGEAGWSSEDWPAVKRGGAWALQAAGWKVLDEKSKASGFFKTLPPAPQPPAVVPVASTGPSTKQATTQAATTAPAAPPVLTDSDGTRYYDGINELRIISKDNHETIVSLPPQAQGTGPVTLIHAGENRLFLFNQPGRVVRLGPADDTNAGWHYETTFTKHIPTTVSRIWKDPAGRIVMQFDQNKLNIFFPEGRVPAELLPLVPNLNDD